MENLICRGLELRNETFQLKVADFTLTPCQICFVKGKSGAGKSSFFDTLAGILPAYKGIVTVGKKNIFLEDPSSRPIAYMPQQDVLFSKLTIRKNLQLAGDAFAELFDLVELPRPLLDKKPSDLSGGELARCNFVRALCRDKPIILLDEPFSHLQKPLRQKISQWLVKQKKILLIADHGESELTPDLILNLGDKPPE